MLLIDQWTVPIKSSNVHSNVKRKGVKGNGEITIYFGQGEEAKKRFSNFFNTSVGIDEKGKDAYIFSDEDTFYFSKEGLINYLYSVQFEYNYQLIREYNAVSLDSWREKIDNIKGQPQEKITFPPRGVINPTASGRRIYLKSTEKGKNGIFISVMRLPLAEITEVTVYKFEVNTNIYEFKFVFKLRTDLRTSLEERDNQSEDTSDEAPNEIGIGENLIVYGAPGTGKSHHINGEFQQNKRRVTFHPEYTYQDFVGSYKPVPVYRKWDTKIINDNNGEIFTKGEPLIDYRFVPGPFTLALADALQYKDRMYTLIIEELNRANAPAVFGDLFQLLDREDDGNSTYSVINIDIANYLRGIEGIDIDQYDNEIIIPFNLNIVATMNSADQGVFVMDSAFKRRWHFRYRPIDIDSAKHKEELIPYGGESNYVKWGVFIKSINALLATNDIKINEDKHIGPYFIKPSDLEGKSDEYKQEIIASKLLIYLWDDVVRHKRTYLFKNPTTFSDLVVRYKAGEPVFKCDFPIVLERREENDNSNNSNVSSDIADMDDTLDLFGIDSNNDE